MGARESLNRRENMARRKVKNGEKDAFSYAFKAHCKKQSCSASMKSANADPYTKFSKGG